MKSDLDRLMTERELDWAFVIGSPHKSADMFYLVNGAKISHCYVLKKRGADPLLIVGSMEREEAQASRLAVKTTYDYDAVKIAKASRSPLEAGIKLALRMFEKQGVAGRVGVYGEERAQVLWPLLRGIERARQDVVLVEELDEDLFAAARQTKDADEVARMRRVGRLTEEVVREALAPIRAGRAEKGVVVGAGGKPVKVGEVKERIALGCARRGLDDGGETIFAIGRDAGIPHSRGDDRQEVPVGKTIVFDIFPREKGGGYCFDMTRTFWVGAVSDRVRAVYEAVQAAFDAGYRAVAPDASARVPDDAACDVFEARGFRTLRTHPETTEGYVHSLGHGIGLDVHERPRVSKLESNRDVIRRGMVLTVEPGLYFPDDEIGIRNEDTVWLRPDGAVENLTELEKEPAIAIPGAGAPA